MKLLDRSFDVELRPASGARLSSEALRSVEQFLYHEVALLDDRELDAWLDLWAEDGRYWIPRFEGQADPFGQISLCWEDHMLRHTRVRRLANPRNWSQQPPARCSHLVGNVSVRGLDAEGCLIVRSSLLYTEWRLEQRQFAATVHHKLQAQQDGAWRMRLKRVDLVNCDAMLGNLELFL